MLDLLFCSDFNIVFIGFDFLLVTGKCLVLVSSVEITSSWPADRSHPSGVTRTAELFMF